MYDFTAILSQVTNFWNTALAALDPSTPMGGLFFIALASGVIIGVIRGFRSVLPK